MGGRRHAGGTVARHFHGFVVPISRVAVLASSNGVEAGAAAAHRFFLAFAGKRSQRFVRCAGLVSEASVQCNRNAIIIYIQIGCTWFYHGNIQYHNMVPYHKIHTMVP